VKIRKWNLLCIRKKENLDLGHKLLYDPYKNIITKLVELSINKESSSFDPISKVFDGLESVPNEIKDYYESLLSVTSYYQASKGGRGKYIEKKLSSFYDKCSIDLKLSELPNYIINTDIYRKKGIFTTDSLTSEEKSILRKNSFDWIGKREYDETIDISNLINNNLILMEIKNRVDSGGTAARREIWTKKFKNIISLLINTNIKLYRKEDEEFSLVEFLKSCNINKIKIYIGILFDLNGNPATINEDRRKGFYSSNIEGFNDLKNFISESKNIKIIHEETTEFKMVLVMNNFDFYIEIGACYGNEITKILFDKDYSLNELLILKYDDIWLTLLTTIDERTFLLKFGENFTKIFLDKIKMDSTLRKIFDEFINSEGKYEELIKIIRYLIENYNENFKDIYVPNNYKKEEYLGNIVQILGAYES